MAQKTPTTVVYLTVGFAVLGQRARAVQAKTVSLIELAFAQRALVAYMRLPQHGPPSSTSKGASRSNVGLVSSERSQVLRRSASHRPEHPHPGNVHVPLPCRSESCPSALAVSPSAPMLAATRPCSLTLPSAVKNPRSPAWLISPLRMNSSTVWLAQDPWSTSSDTDQSPS